MEPYEKPHIFFDTTYDLDAEHRADAVVPLMASVKKAGMVAAGYIQVSAHGRAVMDTWGHALYYPYTLAQYSVTVRDPKGIGSGWAGVDWSDWTKIDAQKLSDIALDKCLRSRNPVAVEPGRYTTILEPQAVANLCDSIMQSLDRQLAESGNGPFAAGHGNSRIGEKVFDERITISADPMDSDLGFPPFSNAGNVYHPVTWVQNGVLKELAYFRPYGIRTLGKNTGLPNSGAYRMSGGTTSIDEMIATTKRGVLVTRFWGVHVLDPQSLLSTGYTRDGLWLIENGKISKPIKNFRFTESPMFVLNNVEQLGVPQRVFHPQAPVVVPPIKARDFSFTALSEAI
jgi:predicted Zn-dependent protease